MGFELDCVLTLDSRVFPLFDRVIPGGSGHALRTSGPGLPDGWALPGPWHLQHGVGGRLAVRTGVVEPADPVAWRARAGVPEGPDPLDAFDDTDFRPGSLLSLAAPVVITNDHTFGGVLAHERAALFVGGELVAAQGSTTWPPTASTSPTARTARCRRRTSARSRGAPRGWTSASAGAGSSTATSPAGRTGRALRAGSRTPLPHFTSPAPGSGTSPA